MSGRDPVETILTNDLSQAGGVCDVTRSLACIYVSVIHNSSFSLPTIPPIKIEPRREKQSEYSRFNLTLHNIKPYHPRTCRESKFMLRVYKTK